MLVICLTESVMCNSLNEVQEPGFILRYALLVKESMKAWCEEQNNVVALPFFLPYKRGKRTGTTFYKSFARELAESSVIVTFWILHLHPNGS